MQATTERNITTFFQTHFLTKRGLSNEFQEVLTSNLQPLKKDIYQNDDYDMFLERRSELFIGEIDQACES